MPNELKPEDVMRALECCIKRERENTSKYCDNCPSAYANYGDEVMCCLDGMYASAIALLREKDAEIERLHRVSAETNDRNFRLLEATKKSCEARINLAIREAITEFAERLKTFYKHLPGNTVGGAVEYHIDQIAKDMKEGKR